VEANLARHRILANLAIYYGAKLVIFPELSLTGYEPRRAAELARPSDDWCFLPFQAICDRHEASIGVGFPLSTGRLPRISTMLLRPHLSPLIYSKMYLHPDELPYFEPGSDSPKLIHADPAVALAICYELSVPQHAQEAHQGGAALYIASVAKITQGVEQASRRLSQIASQYSMPVLMSNCLGILDGAECTGCSSAWNRQGELIAQLDSNNEGIIVLDDVSGKVISISIQMARQQVPAQSR
jgi:predicted amidohydrolase